MTTQTDASWEILFTRHQIAEQVAQHGYFTISAKEINTVREARLMAKFDVKQSLPAIFRHHHLSILPISRGDYVIGPFETYQAINYQHFPHARPLRIPPLDTLAGHDIHSEAEALLVLQNSGALHDIFASTQVYQTLQGRRGSGQFTFQITSTTRQTQTIVVNNAQIEIDAAFETPTHIFICEAKNVLVHDLLIRQLYYPYRFVAQKSPKTITPMSIIYNNFTFYITRYTVRDPLAYNSLTPTDYYSYTLDTQPFQWADVAAIWVHCVPRRIDDIPFPQADDLRIVLTIVRMLQNHPCTKADITHELGYDKRQTDYYVNAGRWLGFIDDKLGLSQTGIQIASAAAHQQKRLMVQAIFATPLFYEMGQLMLARQTVPERDEVVAAIAMHALLGDQISGETRPRRAQTVQAWLRWIQYQLTV